jgi:hypothetical protein
MLSSDNEPDIDREKKAISHTDLAILLPEIDSFYMKYSPMPIMAI